MWSRRGQALGAGARPLNQPSRLFFREPPILGGIFSGHARRREWRPATPSFMFSVGIQPQLNQQREVLLCSYFHLLKDKTQLSLFSLTTEFLLLYFFL